MDLQSLFNQLALVDRAAETNYTAEYLSWRQDSPELATRFGKPFVTATLRFTSSDSTIASDTHVYLSYDLDILGKSGLLDPKAIFLLRRVHFYASGQPNQ